MFWGSMINVLGLGCRVQVDGNNHSKLAMSKNWGLGFRVAFSQHLKNGDFDLTNILKGLLKASQLLEPCLWLQSLFATAYTRGSCCQQLHREVLWDKLGTSKQTHERRARRLTTLQAQGLGLRVSGFRLTVQVPNLKPYKASVLSSAVTTVAGCSIMKKPETLTLHTYNPKSL